MTLAQWKALLSCAGDKPLPLDLRHAVETFPTIRTLFSECLGHIVLYLALKFPTPRRVFETAWLERREEEACLRVFNSLQVVARTMHSLPNAQEASEIGGPLHAHGWQVLLQKMFIMRRLSAEDVGNEVLVLGNTGTRFSLCEFSEQARVAIHAFQALDACLEYVFIHGAPVSVPDWKQTATILCRAFLEHKVPGLTGGYGTYCTDWLVRSLLIPFMRFENVYRLAITGATALIDLNGPDAKNKRKVEMESTTGETLAVEAFRKVGYGGAPELFTMWLCLFGSMCRSRKKWARGVLRVPLVQKKWPRGVLRVARVEK